MNKNSFEEWIESYPESMHHEFHRDGVIEKKTFAKEGTKVLFVAKEPNSKNGNYDKYLGVDLRQLWREEIPLKKPFNYNIARWTRIICDGVDAGGSLSWEDVAKTMRRAAIINLKKMAGSGAENREEVCLYSYKDRRFIKSQILDIKPDVMFACGKDGFVFRMLWRIMNDEICFPTDNDGMFHVTLRGRSVPVFSVYHPSLRKPDEDKAAVQIANISKRFRDWRAKHGNRVAGA